MGFESFLGNERLKQNLEQSLRRGHISHFYLISGPRGAGKKTLAKLIAAAILCREEKKPCMKCGICRRCTEGGHPDFITVEDPEQKNVAVRIVRRFREDVFILPNEYDYKIYLFHQDMGVEGQNALLKILEEPPKYGVFLLLTDNPAKLLPTVRSRCTELKMQALPEDVLRRELQRQFPKSDEADIAAAMVRSGGFLGQAKALLEGGDSIPPQTEGFVKAVANRDSLVLVQTLVPMEKWKRDALAEILQSWLELMESALVCRSGIQIPSAHARCLAASRSSPELREAAAHLRKAVDYTLSNVSPAAVCGYLEWALR
jgi:DNA polymerase-3 subunit delta'